MEVCVERMGSTLELYGRNKMDMLAGGDGVGDEEE